MRDQLAGLCNTLVRFLTKAVLDPIVWRTTNDWASFKSQARFNDVVYPDVTTEDIHTSLGKSLHLALGGVLGVDGWRLEDLMDLTQHIVAEVAERARSVISNIMITQSSIPGGFKSECSVSQQTLREMVFFTASVLQGYLAYTIASGGWSSNQTQLTEDRLFARPAALEHLISGDILKDIPVEPFLYVYTDGWKHDHESGVRGLFEMNRRESQAEESHKLRLLIQQSLAEPAPVSVAPGAAHTASTKRKSLWKSLVGKRSSKVAPLGVPTAPTAPTPGNLFKNTL